MVGKPNPKTAMGELQGPASTTKVLVAEDNLINQKILKVLLQKGGYEVTMVSNGKEALAVLAQHSPDVVVLDYQMPELNGLETLKAIREHSRKSIQSVRVVFFTGESNEQTLQDIKDLKVSYVLRKPVQPDRLLDVLLQLQTPPEAAPVAAGTLHYLHRITDGNRPLMVELIEIFMQEAPAAIQNMKTHRSAGDWAALGSTIHKIRSNYKYIGVDAADELLEEWETALGKAELAAFSDEYVQKLERITRRAMEALTLEKLKLLESE
jgi:CheY-like chemotaxis protein/HPt (histidine-containing phosphotransfer) domain-containing protein